MLHKVKVEVFTKFPACLDDKCPFTRECANHRTAGDFRTEDGLTPDLHQAQTAHNFVSWLAAVLTGKRRKVNGNEGEWVCSKSPKHTLDGAVLIDGTYANDHYHH